MMTEALLFAQDLHKPRHPGTITDFNLCTVCDSPPVSCVTIKLLTAADIMHGVTVY